MANRSDFLTAKLPRSLKRMIALIPDIDAHQSGDIRRIFIKAHAAHVGFKTKRIDADTSESPAEAV